MAEETLTRLNALRAEVERADSAWFTALAAGDKAEAAGAKERHKRALAEFRAEERAAMAAGVRETCWRCGGHGVVNYGRVILTATYRDGTTVSDRFCFACHGAKTLPLRKHRFDATAPTRVKRKRDAEAKAAATAAEAKTNWDAWAADNAEIAEFLLAADADDDFLVSMRGAVERWGALTEKQAAAVERSIERARAERERLAKLENAGEFPRGRTEVTGEVVSVKTTRGYAGGTAHKMLVVLDSGHKAYGSVPEALWSEAYQWTMKLRETDDSDLNYGPEDFRVRFTADFLVSDDDSAFGFFKRPTKVEVLGLRDRAAA